MSDESLPDGTLTERERDELLEKVYRGTSTLGERMPERIEIDGETVPLREWYVSMADRDDVAEDEAARIEEILSYLRRRRMALIKRIRTGTIEYEAGVTIVEEVHALDRAINAIESLSEPTYEEAVRRERIASARELVDLMREFGNP
ncbi:DUF5788 family protein [Halorarum halobium]|uniref:DUF5788 family protein n=1 Tax=Halorarum halobium TaxID=3075121 RepID=UPI0028B0ED8C|nr:DUF5788 family protein [Halobaculum sp. XH14]